MSSGGPNADSVGRIPQLDGVRGCAVLLVVICHYYNNLTVGCDDGIHRVLRPLFCLAWSGVDLFFVLSGFLIGRILINQRESPNYYQAFYLRRVFRILPIYLLLLLLFCFIFYGFPWKGHPALEWLVGDPMPLYSYFLFTQNFYMAEAHVLTPKWLSATWSLAVEEQFYLLLPLLIRAIRPRMLLPVVLVLALCAPLFRFVLIKSMDQEFVATYVLLFSRMDALLLGVVAACLMRLEAFHGFVRNRPGIIPGVLAVASVSCLCLFNGDRGLGTEAMSGVGLSALAFCYFLFLLMALTSKSKILYSVLTFPPLVWAGTVSYFVYLFHYPFLGLMHHFLAGAAPAPGSPVLPTLAALIFTFVSAHFSWKYLEKKMIDFGRSGPRRRLASFGSGKELAS